MHDVTLFVAVHSPKSRHCSITFHVTAQWCDNACLEMWAVELPEILKLSLEMRRSSRIRDT